MHISAGKYKGCKITFPKTGNVRPVMAIVREAFFSIFFNQVLESNFLDVFAGTGIMSLEALSRGAGLAHLVDYNRLSKNVLIKNFEFVSEPYKFFFSKAEFFLKKNNLFYDLIYLDPPFKYSFKEDLLKIISRNESLKKDTKIIIHYPSRENLDDNILRLFRYDFRKYGDSRLDFFKVNSYV
ncbi:16S rRNA (guanine(966)-N(2))-methyltransferase RsmD [Borrelia miyamotoi]|uniref:16S rRNA (Guanine(966)-N(2))-methyltransferase RsmD n=1 Tax=Borrelia miyamotoi TaxID=47466 RepID=A0AAQ2WWK1_9SPIR|nr:16S rRNA (guanine(966)-N(2))-methyltransferase RsmD [Borrelia miyamotoi]AGT27201.1 methyltransferase [Borrelia miyamotoi LB-2001]AJA58389.1 methyltransferase [Borrelia miyamotoi]AOW96038.1 16S rRNA (guanine(966)-N(2))-methyltransferase RsmD [Borrelia miyamotoi]QTL83352.1 16S rRNA (guanine(966)-N(2))-methyltransferase RsmD [Borrelia miyamotoi]WAZ85353.1 16S rRNA (guanine(966)-N(2))-methyltransferase RsmD [Borrelia miyamotoi]